MDTSAFTPEALIQGEDALETEELKAMLDGAKAYVSSFDWCPQVRQAFMGLGIGGVLGVYLLEFCEPIRGQDDYLWVVEGDVPSAYLVVDDAEDAVAALAIYCHLMEDWCNAVAAGNSLDEVYPVDAPPDREHARMLRHRIAFIRSKIIPEYNG